MSSSPKHVALSRAYSDGAAIGVAVSGLAGLAGWWLDFPILKSGVPGLLTMKANTAACFLFLGIGLWFSQAERLTDRTRTLVRQLSAVVVLVGVVTLVEYVSGWDLRIDRLLFTERAGPGAGASPGRMTPMSAVLFVLMGGGLYWLDVEVRRGWRPGQVLALMACSCSIVGLFGYIYTTWTTPGHSVDFAAMSMPSAMACCVFCSGILCVRPAQGVMKILTSSGPGGTMARHLCPIVVLLPLALDFLTIPVQRGGPLSLEADSLIDCMVIIIVLLTVVFFTARLLDRKETERVEAEAALRESEAKYRQLIEQAHEGVLVMNAEGRALMVNPCLARMLGRTVAEITGESVFQLMDERNGTVVRAALERCQQGRNERYEVEMLNRNGSVVCARISASAITDDQGGVTGTLALLEDITERKKTEAERERLIRELRKALAEVKTLSGIIPICAGCKQIRDGEGYWSQVESYLSKHSLAQFSHGLCPDCVQKYYPEFSDDHK